MTQSEFLKAETVGLVYERMNAIAEPGSIVLFGSTFFSRIPVDELTRFFGISEVVYNRSVEGMTVREAAECLKTCVLDLNPSKVFIGIGDADLNGEDFNPEEFVSQYEWLLYTIHRETRASIYIVSTFGAKSETVNRRLRQLSQESGCVFVDGTDAFGSSKPELNLFYRLKYHFRKGRMDFTTAMSASALM